MGLFDKKFCDICGEKIGLLGNRKLEDGNLCKDCAAKLSPWFSERKASTVEDIRGQLEYREANKEAVAAFNTTTSYGQVKKLLLDQNNGKFMIAATRNYQTENPDVLDFSQVTGCDIEVKENKTEQMTKDAEGHSVSYNPRRYTYNYDFYCNISVNHPYFNEMSFKLNDTSVTIDPNTTTTTYGGMNAARPMNQAYGQTRPMTAPQSPTRPAAPTGRPANTLNTPIARNMAANPGAAARPMNNLAAMNHATVKPQGASIGAGINAAVNRGNATGGVNARMNTPVRPNLNTPPARPVTPAARPAVNTGYARPVGMNQAVTTQDPQVLASYNTRYQSYLQMGDEIKAALTQIHDDYIADMEAKQEAMPTMAVNCPYCGGVSVPDETGCCAFCGASLVGLF